MGSRRSWSEVGVYKPALIGGAGPGRREGGQSFGISRGPGGVLRLEESWSCLSRRGNCVGEGPPSCSLPHEGGLAPAAAASLSAPCPISSLWPTRLPPPQRAKPVPAWVRGRE